MNTRLRLLSAGERNGEMFKYDYESVLGTSQMLAIRNGWIYDENKMQNLAESDNRDTNKIIQDVVLGMVGEQGAYNWLSKNYKCKQPFFGVLERNEDIWSRDLVSLEGVRIKTAYNSTQIVERSISCKSQFCSITHGLGDSEPSWTFQDKTVNRFPDPMLRDPLCNKLLVACWINDKWDGGEVYYRNPTKAYKLGFRWKVRMVCFWWPDVFPFLAEMHREDLRDKKRALYYVDIKHLRSEILPRIKNV